MHPKRGGYSFLIRPILVVLDLCVLSFFIHIFLFRQETLLLYFFVLTGWLIAAFGLSFYEVYRFTKPIKIVGLLVRQSILFAVILYAYFGLVKSRTISIEQTAKLVFLAIATIGVIKILIYYVLKKYRSYLGGNNRQIVVFGDSEGAQELKKFFKKRKDLGYHIMEVFGQNLSKSIEDGMAFINSNNVDEIYCSIDEVTDEEVNSLISYADKNFSVLKFIPNTKRFLSKHLKTDYYEYLPVLSIPEVALNNVFNRLLKRTFDVIFSLFIIILILSWLTPILFVIIRLESKGSIFYKHVRNGINYHEFVCYKFRSLRVKEDITELHVKKNDERVTKIGRFIRRTSIDELPQFYNVLKGDMSVVGPRPHMVQYTQSYAKKIDKYNFMFRHVVKPGVTGMAQIKGYRGEIKSDEDIINRIKYDIFYIENWSIFLDIKIIIDTAVSLIKGDENAY